MSKKVNLSEKLASFQEPWVPKVVGELNGQLVKVAKFLGEYVWHHHENEDELFWVVKGSIKILLRDREITLTEGEFFIVPRASSTSRSPNRRPRSSCSSRTPRSTPATRATSSPSRTSSASRCHVVRKK